MYSTSLLSPQTLAHTITLTCTILSSNYSHTHTLTHLISPLLPIPSSLHPFIPRYTLLTRTLRSEASADRTRALCRLQPRRTLASSARALRKHSPSHNLSPALPLTLQDALLASRLSAIRTPGVAQTHGSHQATTRSPHQQFLSYYAAPLSRAQSVG